MKSIIKIIIVLIITFVMANQDRPTIHLTCSIPKDQLEPIAKTHVTQTITTRLEFENLIQTIHQDDFDHSTLKLVSLDSINQPDYQDTILLNDGSCIRAKFSKDQLEYLVYILPNGKFGWDEQALLAKILNPFIYENLNSNFDFYKIANGLDIFDDKQDARNFKLSNKFRTFQTLFLMNKKKRNLSIMIYK